MHFEICRGIRDQREAGCVGFRKSIERERRDPLHDAVLRRRVEAAFGHAFAEFYFKLLHSRHRSLHADGAAEFLGLRSGEAGDGHRYSQ